MNIIGTKAQNLISLKKRFPNNVPDLYVVGPHKDLESEYIALLKIFKENELVAFRTSASLEDMGSLSFAGLYSTYLNIPLNKSNFLKYYNLCRDSITSAKVKSYLHQNNILSEIECSVIVQRMFEGIYYGVAFIDNDNSRLSYGKLNGVVGGEKAVEIKIDENVYRNLPGEVESDIWKKLINTLEQISKFFDAPQDIEWAVSRKNFAILQSRAITQYLPNTDKITWDSTNIGENYPGVTAPLTFSFIKEAYCNVYTNFMRVLKVNEKTITQNRPIFENMLGYILGHVYYNINNWYGLLKLMPFYNSNKGFFENMLNPAKLDNSKPTTSKFKFDIRTGVRFLSLILFPGKYFKEFDTQFHKNFILYKKHNLKALNYNQLVDLFDTLSFNFFNIWAYTIINDFRVMVYFGILKLLAVKWIKQVDTYLNSIVNMNDFPDSMEPLSALLKISQTIKNNPKYVELFNLPDTEILQKIKQVEYKELDHLFETYLNDFGNRSANELKLEEPKFNERPESLLSLIKDYVRIDLPTAGKESVNLRLDLNPFLKGVLNILKVLTVKAIYKREEFRLKRGKVYSIARDIFLAIGERFENDGILGNKADIFYLYKTEIWNSIRFHGLSSNLKTCVQARKAQLKEYAGLELPIRVITFGHNSNSLNYIDDSLKSEEGHIKGDVTSHGETIEAEVVVMHEFNLDQDVKNKILIVPKTDPGWTIVFPLLKGIITERGNTLSHASIIARELGIPCIVNVKGATRIFKTGDLIRLDSRSGLIKFIN